MRVLIDAYWWENGPPSGRNVLRSMVATWLHAYPKDELTLLAPPADVARVARDPMIAVGRAVVRPYPRWARNQALACLSIRAADRDFDLVVTQNFAPQFASARSGVLVHDAIFASSPEWFTKKERAYLSLIRPLLRRADVVYTTSDTETRRIGSLWPEATRKLCAVGLAVPRSLKDAAPTEPQIPRARNYVLAVGRLNVRKNLRVLIDAFQQFSLRRDDVDLVIVGHPDGLSDIGEVVGERVVFTGSVSDGELRWLYQHASVFVFPSLDEGFGLPILEAASEGVITLASDIPVFRELGLADDYFDPMAAGDIARTIEEWFGKARKAAEPYKWSDVVRAVRLGATQGVGRS